MNLRIWERLEGCVVTVPPHVAFRTFAQESVLLNLRTGKYHGVNGVGARFFEATRDCLDVGSAATLLAAEFDQPEERIRTDLMTFLEALRSRDLIELRNPSAVATERSPR